MEYLSAVLAGLFEGIGESLWGQVVLSIAGGVILLEIMGLIEGGSVQLLRFGASLLPPALRERYIEENEDGIRSAKGPFYKLFCTLSAVSGAIYMKIFLKREELDSLERSSQSEERTSYPKVAYSLTHEVAHIHMIMAKNN